MSYDFATARLCTHEVALESFVLDPETRLTAPFPKPPANSAIRVFIDRTEVPSSGLWSVPAVPFSKREPYRIRRGENDLIYFGVGFSTPRLVQLLPGPAVRAKDLARDLQRQFPDLVVEDVNGHVVFRTYNPTNGTAFQFHDPRWTDRTESMPTTPRILATYSSLGIVPGRAATGRRIFPGWTIQADPDSPLQSDRRLLFSDIIRNADPVVEVCYVTTAQNCRRCFGSRVEFDYSVSNSTYETVRNTDLLIQEFDKFLFTRRGSHFKWNWLGSGIVDRIGGKGDTAQAAASALINMDIQQAFASYQNVKQQQLISFPNQRVTDAEFPADLAGVGFSPVKDDPTVVIAQISIRSQSRVPVPVQRLIGLPDPLSLAGQVARNLLLSNEPYFRRG